MTRTSPIYWSTAHTVQDLQTKTMSKKPWFCKLKRCWSLSGISSQFPTAALYLCYSQENQQDGRTAFCSSILFQFIRGEKLTTSTPYSLNLTSCQMKGEKREREKNPSREKPRSLPKTSYQHLPPNFFFLTVHYHIYYQRVTKLSYLIRKFIEELNRYLLRLEIQKCWLVLKRLFVSDLIKSFPPLSGSAALPPLPKETPCSHSSCRPLMWRHFLHHADPCFPSPML